VDANVDECARPEPTGPAYRAMFLEASCNSDPVIHRAYGAAAARQQRGHQHIARGEGNVAAEWPG